MSVEQIHVDDWNKLGKKLFGEKGRNWKFVCPQCKTVQTGQDLLDLGIELKEVEGYLGFSCIGRFNDKKVGCDWTLGGLFKIHELEVMDDEGKPHPRFKFYEEKNDSKKTA